MLFKRRILPHTNPLPVLNSQAKKTKQGQRRLRRMLLNFHELPELNRQIL
jgi:hypothetical protein